MLTVIIAMIAILFVSAIVGTYVAFPHRGEAVPSAEWVGDLLSKASAALPILSEAESASLRR